MYGFYTKSELNIIIEFHTNIEISAIKYMFILTEINKQWSYKYLAAV